VLFGLRRKSIKKMGFLLISNRLFADKYDDFWLLFFVVNFYANIFLNSLKKLK